MRNRPYFIVIRPHQRSPAYDGTLRTGAISEFAEARQQMDRDQQRQGVFVYKLVPLDIFHVSVHLVLVAFGFLTSAFNHGCACTRLEK